MSDTKHLWNRGGDNRQNWYLRLPVPRPIRDRWPLSKTGMIIQPLDTDSLAAAQRRRDELTVAYRRVFDRIAAGEVLTPKQIAAATAIDALDPRSENLIRSWGGESWLTFMREMIGQLPPEVARSIAVGVPSVPVPLVLPEGAQPPAEPAKGETITQALEEWLAEVQSDKATAIRADTVSGHRGRVKAFTDKFGDMPLASITRQNAAEFLGGLKCQNQTKNQYVMTIKAIIEGARKRGRFGKNEDNPFAGQRKKFEREERDRYTDEEALMLLAAFGPREVKPAKHTVKTALPWIVAIAAYHGTCLEETAQLQVSDIIDVVNGTSSLTVIDIRNGDKLHSLKNDETRPRKIPLHSALKGLLQYAKALPQDGPLFPGLKRRADGRVGAYVGLLFNRERERLGITRKDMLLDFHSWRTTAASKMDEAGIPEHHMNGVLGHAQKTETTRTYSKGPGIHNLKEAVEAIQYGLAQH
jgi:integrase